MKLAFSESGIPSSKRVMGGLLGIALIFCLIYVVTTTEFNEEVSGTIKFGFGTMATLFGISMVTNIAKKGGTK